MSNQERIQEAVNGELAKLVRVQRNINQAHEDGLISAHDCEERKARYEQAAANRIAWIKGDPRPVQRELQPLDDPNAGIVG